MTEFDLANQDAAMAALIAARRSAGIYMYDLEDKSGVSSKAYYKWVNCQGSPRVGMFVALAQTLGFDVLMRREGDEWDMRDVRVAVNALVAERERMNLPVAEVERLGRIGMSTFYAWQAGGRDPILGKFVRMAAALGFEVVMRRRELSNQKIKSRRMNSEER